MAELLRTCSWSIAEALEIAGNQGQSFDTDRVGPSRALVYVGGRSGPRPAPGALIHSDHGTQFTSWAFTERAKRSGLLPSMGSISDCFDNAVVESFWARMQVELLNRKRWKARVELANAIFEYIEIFHNRRRWHSSLGMLTPIEYEKIAHPSEVA